MARKFRKRPDLHIVAIPGVGRMRDNQIVEGEQYARFVPHLLEEVAEATIPASPPPPPPPAPVKAPEPAPAPPVPAPEPAPKPVSIPPAPDVPEEAKSFGVLTEPFSEPDAPVLVEPAPAPEAPPVNEEESEEEESEETPADEKPASDTTPPPRKRGRPRKNR